MQFSSSGTSWKNAFEKSDELPAATHLECSALCLTKYYSKQDQCSAFFFTNKTCTIGVYNEYYVPLSATESKINKVYNIPDSGMNQGGLFLPLSFKKDPKRNIVVDQYMRPIYVKVFSDQDDLGVLTSYQDVSINRTRGSKKT